MPGNPFKEAENVVRQEARGKVKVAARGSWLKSVEAAHRAWIGTKEETWDQKEITLIVLVRQASQVSHV